MMLYMGALVLYLLMITWITAAAAYQQQPLNFTEMKPNSGQGFVLLPIVGNVYPLGYYAVTLYIGNPAKPYLLDIDTGSDLTWISCDGTQPRPPNPYDFTKGSSERVPCHDDVCLALGDDAHKESHNNCKAKSLADTHPCDYTVGYADGTKVHGFLVSDLVHLRIKTPSKLVSPRLAFGCGFHEVHEDPVHQRNKDGILGLGKGGAGILTQLSKIGVTGNVVGHCLSGKGGGHIFFGETPLLGIVWKPIVRSDQHYSLGSADIMFGDHATDIRGLHIVFDSGSTYTYLKTIAYEALLDLITKNLKNKLQRAHEDKTLTVCWKGARPFRSIDDVASYFWNLALSFTSGRNVKFQMYPHSYLIISDKGNVCLGILDGGEVGLGDLNIIGDISMHDKWVIYDNMNGQVGWANANCNF